MQETVELDYVPYRSEKEPITEVFDSKVTLHKDYFESIRYYTFDACEDGIRKENSKFKQATIQRKNSITLTRAMYGDDDEDVPGVAVYDGEYTLFKFKTDKEADKFYSKIRNWLLNS